MTRGLADTISFTKLRELDLDTPTQPGRPSYLAAASGLVCVRDALYVVADDEVHLGVFIRNDPSPGRLVRLRSMPLDLDPQARKRAKPDFESLVALPALPGFEHGALLALGSGSTPRRMSATCIPFDAAEHLLKTPYTFDLAPWYAAVANAVGEVNIEGAIVQQDRLLLFQRGNKGRGINAVVGFELDDLRAALGSHEGRSQPQALFVHEPQLGDIDDIPLGFTDAAALPDGSILFSAVAEDTRDSYADGASVGSAIGVLDRSGRVQHLRRVREGFKIEGIHVEAHAGRLRLLAVTDDDDARIPAALLGAEWTL